MIIATLKSNEDKKVIMSAKKTLKCHRSYSSVYINHDQTTEERRLAANMRTLVDAVKKGDSNLIVRGSRILTSNDNGYNTQGGRGNINNRRRHHNDGRFTNTRDTNTRSSNDFTRNNNDNRGNNVCSGHDTYDDVRRDSHYNRDSWQSRTHNHEQSPRTDQEWDTAGRDGRHRGNYSRQGNYRQNKY